MPNIVHQIAGSVAYPSVLVDSREIAAHIATLATDYVCEEMIEELFRFCSATLRLIPLDEIKEGNPDGNVACPQKETRYLKKKLSTMPPIVVMDGVIEDGNHRYRVAKALGAVAIWCYVVTESEA